VNCSQLLLAAALFEYLPGKVPPHLTIGDDVKSRHLLRADRHDRGDVVRLLEVLRLHPPQLSRPHPRRKAPGELGPVDQPIRLGLAAHQRGRQDRQWDDAAVTVVTSELRVRIEKFSISRKTSLGFKRQGAIPERLRAGYRTGVPTCQCGAVLAGVKVKPSGWQASLDPDSGRHRSAAVGNRFRMTTKINS
jgi:hypothetical protein